MNEQERDRLVGEYLARLSRELGDVPAGARRELLEDVRSHIDEAWSASPDRSRAALMNILERLGSPEELAREERDKLGLSDTPVDRPAGLLEVAAIVLTAIFWPVGLLLVWLSSRWDTRDKIVATAIPLVGLAVLLSLMAVSFVSYSSSASTVVQERAMSVEVAPGQAGPGPEMPPSPAGFTERPASPSIQMEAVVPIASLLVLYCFLGAPITSALYLGLRLWSRVRRRVLLAAAAAPLVILLLLLSFITPVTSRSGHLSTQPAESVIVQDPPAGSP